MAEVQVGTTVSTEEVVADERVIDMDPQMRRLDPDQTQFTTMTQRMPSRSTTREKFNWLEEQYVNDVYSMTAYTSGATSITLTNITDANAIRVNDVLRNMRTGQAMIVTANAGPGTGVLTVAPQGANAAGNAGDRFLFVGSAHPQAAALPAPKYSARVLGFNYTQIFRSSWSFSRTATNIELYGGSEPAKEAARKAVEHKRELEHNGFFGSRFFLTPGGGAEPQGGSGGLIEFISTNKFPVGGELTSDFLDLSMATVLAKGSSDKVIFTGTIGAYYISRFHRSGQGAFWKPSRENVHGVQVDGFISGVFGYEIPVVVKKEWSNYPSGSSGYNGLMFVIDMSNVERRPLRDSDTKLLTNRQPNGEDRMAAEYLTEQGWTVAQEKTHGLFTGIA